MKTSTSCFDCPNVDCFLKLCSPKWIQNIELNKSEIHYKKGQNIFNVGDYVSGMYFIKSGKVKVVSNGLNDKEQIVRLATDSDILGHRGFGGETYPVSAIALDFSLICFVDNETISAAFNHNPQFTVKLMLFYAQELRAIEARITYLAQMTVREKVALSLLYLIDVFGYDLKEQIINVDISRADIASICGTNVEQVIRNLSDFEKDNYIVKEGKKIIIKNEAGLREMLDKYNLVIPAKKQIFS